jgi:LTXXQ motif family protein
MSKEGCVNKLLLAGAIAATAALIAPGFAQVPATPPAPPAATAPSAAPEPPASDEGDGAMMHREGGWGTRGMMMRRMMAQRIGGNPQQKCIDRLAWRAARLAYVEAKLDLTSEQRQLWDKVQAVAQSAEQKERQLCGQLKPSPEATVLERIDWAQQFLSARLEALQAAKPAVQALYQALTPEQREVFDHPFRS